MIIVIVLVSNVYSFQIPSSLSSSLRIRKYNNMNMMLGGIAERMTGIVELLQGQQKVTEQNVDATLKEIKAALLDADVNLVVANTLISKVKEKVIGMNVPKGKTPGEQFITLLAAELVDAMGTEQVPLSRRTDGRPNIILMAGLQGAGKTTAAAKLANWVNKNKLSSKTLLVAADIYRPAAIEQLQTLGARLNVDVYTEGQDVSPVKICRNALSKAVSEKYEYVIIDTAGRQVVDDKLMDELKQVKAAVSPDDVLLVVDAMTGQEAATLTARFNEDIGISGAILTKMDGDTRGGSALSVRGVSGKPIKFIGVGEGIDDLEPFFPNRMASRILGLGDIESLLEKATDSIDKEQMTEIGKKMQKGQFDFNDFMAQSQSVKKIGGMANMIKMLPGVAGKITDEMIFETEKKLQKHETIIMAMTEEERSNPDLIILRGGNKEKSGNATERRKNLAKQTGLTIDEVEGFVTEFINMKKMMQRNLKGMDVDAVNSPEGAPMKTEGMLKAEAKQAKKIKPSRGGGSGFGSR